MRYEKNRKILGIDEYLFMKFLKFMILPLIIISLIIIIVVVDKFSKKSEAESTGETLPAISETTAQEKKQAGDEITDAAILASLQELIERYYMAKAEGDVTALYEIFGMGEVQDAEGITQRIQDEAKIYESFGEFTLYAYQGVEANSYVVFTSCRIKFEDVATMVPGFNRAYIYQAEDGGYHMKQTYVLNDEETALVNALSKSEKIEALESNMRTELAGILLGDAELSTLYQNLLGIEAKTEIIEEETTAVEDAVVSIETTATVASETTETTQESATAEETSESTEGTSE